ncbi:MAG: N-acetylmuramoyl-L-alanine amidase [Tissierellia bacterium]|nr:N-acetylmuramoyl-L-alanine amidase [Tissierellia bacterium]
MIICFSLRINAEQVKIEGKFVDTIQVSLEIDGKKADSPFPIFALNERTYVPLRFVSETMGYKVDWLQATKTVQVEWQGKRVWFPVGVSKVTTTEGSFPLPEGVTAIFVGLDGHTDLTTYVPVRFLSEYMDRTVDWVQETMTVVIEKKESTSIDLFTDEDQTEITSPDDGEEISNPDGEVVSAPVNNKEKVTLQKVDFITEDTNVNKVVFTFDRPVNFQKNRDGDTIQIVIPNGSAPSHLLGGKTIPLINAPDYMLTEENGQIILQFRIVGDDIAIYKNKNGTTMIAADTFYFKGLEKTAIDGKEQILLKGMGKQRFNKLVLDHPKRIILDFFDMSLVGHTYKEFDISLGFIDRIRMSQFVPDANYDPDDRIVRIVFDIQESVNHPDLNITTVGDDLVIYPEKSLYDYFSYRVTGSDRYISIHNVMDGDFSYDEVQNMIYMSLPNIIPDGSISYNDNLVHSLQVNQGQLQIRLLRNVVVSKEINERGEFTFHITRFKTGQNSDYLIMIDPGHGGSDPGAVSPIDGTSEKDVILPVQRMLEARLKALGYRVVKTNDTVDSYIPVKERVTMANSLRPDLFVSLHANSSPNGTGKGIEVLYCCEKKCALKPPHQEAFAKIMVEELERATGRKSRGIKNRPEILVVGKTQMTAVLVEMGFLTNHEELGLMKSAPYQNSIVEAIITAIERYLKEFL